MAAVRESSQRGRTIATPVVQAHRQTVRLFGQGVLGEQAFGIDQSASDMTVALFVGGGCRNRIASQGPETFARTLHPLGEFAHVFVSERAQQFTRGG